MGSLLDIKGLSNMVSGICDVARDKNTNQKTIDELVVLTADIYNTGAYCFDFGGVSISYFAFAALKWVNTQYSIEQFDNLFNALPYERKERINKIITDYPV